MFLLLIVAAKADCVQKSCLNKSVSAISRIKNLKPGHKNTNKHYRI